MTTTPRLLLALSLAFLLATGSVQSQTPFPLRIEVTQDGLHEIQLSDLAPHVQAATLNAERMRMMKGRMEVPIYFQGLSEGRFTRTSSLIFFGEGNRSHHSRRGVYRLEFKPSRRRLRLRRPPRTSEILREGVLVQEFSEDLVYDPMVTLSEELLDLPRAQRLHWFWARIPPAALPGRRARDNSHSFLLRPSPRPRPVDRHPAELLIRVRGPMVKDCVQEISCEVGGQVVGKKEISGGPIVTLKFTVPNELIKTATIVTLRNTSKQRTWRDPDNQTRKTQRNDVFVDTLTLRYKTLLTGPTTRQPQVYYHLSTPRASAPVSFEFTPTGTGRVRFFDVDKRAWLEQGRVEATPGKMRRVIAVNEDGWFKPDRISPWSKRSLQREDEGADWLCITLERFVEYVRPLADWRESRGLKTRIVTDREIYDSFSGGAFTPGAIASFLAHTQVAWKTKPRYVLLVGDADRDVDTRSRRRVLPTTMVMTLYNGETASDAAFLPAESTMTIGRFPARREDEVLKMVRRTIDYEKKTPKGLWRRRLNFIASEGRFGPQVDQLLESCVRSMLTGLIPAHYDVTMTFASARSPYFYPASEFNRKVLERLNEGTLVYTYMGHGFPLGFDHIRSGRERLPILGMDDLKSIDTGTTPPLVTVVACSTAHFDSPEKDCITEEMMRRSGGPLAVIASTRISHPLANFLLSKDLFRSLFMEKNPGLGEALKNAKKRMLATWAKDPMVQLARNFTGNINLKRLMEDHRHLYVLLGDPAAHLALPREGLSLEAPDRVTLKGRFRVRADIPSSVKGGMLTLALKVRRDRMVKSGKESGDTGPDQRQRYENANNKVILRHRVEVREPGWIEWQVALPEGVEAGPCYITAALETNGGSLLLGSRAIELAAGK